MPVPTLDLVTLYHPIGCWVRARPDARPRFVIRLRRLRFGRPRKDLQSAEQTAVRAA